MPAVGRNVGRLSAIVAGFTAFAVPGTVFAGDIPLPGFMMTWDASGDTLPSNTYDPAEFGSASGNGDGSFTYLGELVNTGWSLSWDCTVDPDPFVTANIVVTNNMAVTQTFSLLMVLPIAPAITPATLMDGSIIGTVTDNNGNDATVAAVSGGSIYTAFIDGGAVQTLMDDPFSASAGGPFLSDNAGPESFADLAGPAANATIAIELEFTLSAGDSASFTSIFEVVIPGPAGVALFGLAGAFGRRRRR